MRGFFLCKRYVEKLSKESQPIYLIVDFESGRILGHEGRHRMLALEEAGIKKMTLHNKYKITIPYSLFDNVKYVAGESNCEIENCQYTDVIEADGICELNNCDLFLDNMSNAFGINVKIVFSEQIYR